MRVCLDAVAIVTAVAIVVDVWVMAASFVIFLVVIVQVECLEWP